VQIHIPNWDPLVCCRIVWALHAHSHAAAHAHVYCATLEQCLRALDEKRVRVSFLWADYCSTVETYPRKDLPYFFQAKLPVDKCLLAVTYSYRGGNDYKNKIDGEKNAGKWYGKATAEQTGRNIEQTFGFTNNTMCA
jgi:hypothetical protein